MALRFIDTDFFKSTFVRGLQGAYKMLYVFIICDCDNSGIWNPEFEIASIFLGQKVTRKDAEKFFAGKFVLLQNGKWFVPGFIEHQYPNGLSEKNPAHKKAICRLKSHNLIDPVSYSILPLKGQESSSEATKVMVEVEVEGVVVEEVAPTPQKKTFDFVGYEDIKDQAEPIIKMVNEKLDTIQKLDKPLTEEQICKLVRAYSAEATMETLIAMDNHKNLLKKYTSAYSTCWGWLKRREKTNA